MRRSHATASGPHSPLEKSPGSDEGPAQPKGELFKNHLFTLIGEENHSFHSEKVGAHFILLNRDKSTQLMSTDTELD